MVRYTKFCDDRPIRSRVILGKPEGGCINPPPCAGEGFKGSVSPSNEYPLYFSLDGMSLFSLLDAIKVLSGLEIIIFSCLIIVFFRYLQQLQLTH